jgi:drug/metabolite transporter (DMT)-like permease
LLSLRCKTYPIITALIEPICYREPFRKSNLFIALGAFVSILIMMPEFNFTNRTTQGILIGILSGLFFMTRNLLIRQLLKTYSSSNLMFWQSIVIVIMLIPVPFTSSGAPYTSNSILLLFLLGVAFTALPQTLFASGLNNLSAMTVGILASLLPLYGAIFGYLIHNEQVTLRTAIGGCFILACVILENARQAHPDKS